MWLCSAWSQATGIAIFLVSNFLITGLTEVEGKWLLKDWILIPFLWWLPVWLMWLLAGHVGACSHISCLLYLESRLSYMLRQVPLAKVNEPLSVVATGNGVAGSGSLADADE
ncbi:hypothetical protein Nepgr_021052 [Nepenthes gracilis]|uniref:Uncharacterized protein n=1 Tax=Nepenthes gracilis TaxID=150966 RepID=A0AAD3SYE4_NEPGR|nr:hypothetical protein Nepgr_021052 [Nepenthes gracilis]